MELKGKTLLFLGDSITAGSGVSGKEETYWYRLGQKTCASCIGYGVGGTRIAEQQQPDGFEALGNFCTRAQQMQKKRPTPLLFLAAPTITATATPRLAPRRTARPKPFTARCTPLFCTC